MNVDSGMPELRRGSSDQHFLVERRGSCSWERGKINWRRGAELVVTGAILGVLLHFWPQRTGESDFHVGSFVLLVPWQATVAVMLAWLFDGGAKPTGE